MSNHLACKAMEIQPPAAYCIRPLLEQGLFFPPEQSPAPSPTSAFFTTTQATHKLIFSIICTLPYIIEIYACEPQDVAEDAEAVTCSREAANPSIQSPDRYLCALTPGCPQTPPES